MPRRGGACLRAERGCRGAQAQTWTSNAEAGISLECDDGELPMATELWKRAAWGNRYRVDVAYDGAAFAGWQTWQNSAAQNRTAHYQVQLVLRTVLRAAELELVSAGRTDAGVHVLCMPCHFDLPLSRTLDPAFLQSARLRCNRLLQQQGIRINLLRRAATEWHSQFSSRGKVYFYHVHVSTEGADPFLSNTHLYLPTARLDVDRMREAATRLIGTHDFSAFTNSDRSRRGKLQVVRERERERERERGYWE